MDSITINSLMNDGFCPIEDSKLLPVCGNDTITNCIESKEGELFYYTYKKADFERCHPVFKEKTFYVLVIWGAY